MPRSHLPRCLSNRFARAALALHRNMASRLGTFASKTITSAALCMILLPAAAQINPASAVRYHFGDDLHWANPNLDDSSWAVAPAGRVPAPPFNSDGFVWIRARVAIPFGLTGPLALRSLLAHSGPDVQELFVKGIRVGQDGTFPPAAAPRVAPEALVFDLPPGIVQAGETAEVVLRGWNMPVNRRAHSRILANFSIDRAALLHAEVGQSQAETLIWYAPNFAADLLLEALGVGVLVLGFWSRRRELFLYALWLVAMPVFLASISLRSIVGLNLRLSDTIFLLINAAGMGIVVEFIWAVQKFRGRFFRGATHLCWILESSAAIFAAVLTHPGPLVTTAVFLDIWLLFAFNVITVSAQLWALFITRRNRAIAAAMALINVGYFLRWAGNPLRIGGLPMNFFEAAFYLSSFIIAGLLIHQTWASWKKGDDLRIEFAAARELQQQLVPLALPVIPGLRMEAAYLPAKDVGGDFYQVLEQPGGSTLVLVGDVSGKGLKAAMTGVLTIGAACALTAEAPNPAALLTRLNREMMRFPRDGFVTCLCIHIASDGAVILANAGHLAPYRNGQEVEVESGLPLGLTPLAEYSDATIHLAMGDTLTLLTDGVLEARNRSGELFGFERTAALSRQPAEEIARTAQAFGQDDDITVLTLTRLAAV